MKHLLTDLSSFPIGVLIQIDSSTFSRPLSLMYLLHQSISQSINMLTHQCQPIKHDYFSNNVSNLLSKASSSCFPESYNLPSFKSNVNKLDLISLSS